MPRQGGGPKRNGVKHGQVSRALSFAGWQEIRNLRPGGGEQHNESLSVAAADRGHNAKLALPTPGYPGPRTLFN